MYEVGQIYKTSEPKTDAEKEVGNNIDWEGIVGNILNNLPETIAAVKGNDFLPPQPPPPPPQRTGLDFFKSDNFIMLAFVVLILVYFLSTKK